MEREIMKKLIIATLICGTGILMNANLNASVWDYKTTDTGEVKGYYEKDVPCAKTGEDVMRCNPGKGDCDVSAQDPC